MKPHANDKHTDTMNISVFCGASLMIAVRMQK
jgi:hypothetical protein